jgi:hypothetical protein
LLFGRIGPKSGPIWLDLLPHLRLTVRVDSPGILSKKKEKPMPQEIDRKISELKQMTVHELKNYHLK